MTPQELRRIAEILTAAADKNLSIWDKVGMVLLEMPHVSASDIMQMSKTLAKNGEGDASQDLSVDVRDDEIIITLPGTKFMVTYQKPMGPRPMMAKSDWTDDPDASLTLGAFRARAWIAATAKARELGWWA